MITVTKFTVVSMSEYGNQAYQVVGHYNNGTELIWGVQTTEQGVK